MALWVEKFFVFVFTKVREIKSAFFFPLRKVLDFASGESAVSVSFLSLHSGGDQQHIPEKDP